MSSAAQRESEAQEDEVVQVFTGDSLEEAMAYAVATLGPDLTVRRARKVRKGLQGLTGKDRYEVVALAPPPVTADGDVVESAFEALLQQAEEVEASRAPAPPAATTRAPAPAAPVRRTTRPAAPSVPPAVLEAVPGAVVEAVAEAVVEAVVEVPAPRAPETAAPAPAPTARRRTPTDRQDQAAPQPRKAAPRHRPSAPRPRTAGPAPVVVPGGWSRKSLLAAGLPRTVIAALPARDPRDDAGWIRALARALATVLPPAAPLGSDNPLTVSGYGLAGVLGILDAARRGFAPGTITYGGRTAPATPTELALAVRSEVVR